MPFRPIEKVQDLPAIGARREDLNLDFKATVVGCQQAEMAKDVAAFANASGGTILVGASENKSTNALQGWVPLSAADAKSAASEFSRAVKDRCSPVPVVDPQVIERDAGQFVVAVNVWPFPLMPVGVRVQSDQATEGKSWDSWIVWVRVGVDSKAFTPEQSAMLMIPEVRRTLTMLDAIPPAERSSIVTSYEKPNYNPGGAPSRFLIALKLVDVRPLDNVALFEVTGQDVGYVTQFGQGTQFAIPLEYVGTIWKGKGGWRVNLKARLEPGGNFGNVVLD